VRDRGNRKPTVRAALALAALAIAFAALASAGAANPSNQLLLDSTVRFLQESQRPSGGFAPAGKKPSQSISAWVALALAAAGVNPRDQARCGVDAHAFLEGNFRAGFREELAWPDVATTAFERELLVVNATGTDPHGFAGFDLAAEILSRQLADGSFPYVPGGRGEVNNTIFAILSLSPVHEPAAEAAIEAAAEWLITQQNDDGGWDYSVKESPSEVDMTGAAIEALNAAGRPNTEAQQEAFEYLRDAQSSDGGFPARPRSERESNVASTAWAVQAIWSAGGNPETWLTGSGEATEEPLDYMESMQQPDGHIRWRQSSDMNGIWMTAYVAPAFAGQALPIPTAPRSVGAVPVSAFPSSCEEPGPGGEALQTEVEESPEDGVIAGGGGNGAPLFSRPRPQSKGKTPGGARVLHNGHLDPINHSKIRRGANTKQPRGTESAEATAAEPPGEEAEAVGAGAGPGGSGSGAVEASSGVAGTSPRAAAAGSGSSGSRFRSGGPSPPAPRGGEASGRRVNGVVVGGTEGASEPGALAFGAPGLRGAGAGTEQSQWVAIAIAGIALLLALWGAQHERRRQELIA
jgi:hypothetical protein